MKRRLLCLLLSAILLLPLLSSCQKELSTPIEPADIYTLYTIADATPEAVRAVELAINRTLYFRIGYIVDIVAVSAEEYDDVINKQFEVMAELEAEKKSKKSKKNTSSTEAVPDEEILTGEKIISMLENGEDIPSTEPSFDIFLIRSYDEYFKLAAEEKLSAVTETLSNEAKLLKNYIHGTFFSAATINKKIYGVPINDTIGEYKFIVFDAELLEKYNYDAKTMVTLEDLENYLALIKENEPDVIPLKEATDSADFDFMFGDGFATYVMESGKVGSTYKNEKLLAYYGMIARYRSLGYFENGSGSNDGRFAVSFLTGNDNDVYNLEKETGYKYEYNIFKKPSATNENTIKSIYGVSKYCTANDITKAMEVLAALFTDPDYQDILTYGIENVNYKLDDNGQVERLNSDYIINPDYTGNKFLTHTLAGDDPEKWEKAKAQNFASTPSKVLGYDFIPTDFEYTDSEENTQIIFEPDYIQIMRDIIDEYYPSIIKGTIVDFDIEALTTEANDSIYAEMKDELELEFGKQIQLDYRSVIEKSIGTSAIATQLRKDAYDQVREEIIAKVKSGVKAKLIDAVKAELGEGATSAEINSRVADLFTDDYIWENRNYNEEDEETYRYNDAEIENYVDSYYSNMLTSEINLRVNNYVNSAAYTSALNKAVNSAAFKEKLDNQFSISGQERVRGYIDVNIADLIKVKTKEMLARFETEIETAIETFVSENAEILDMDREKLLAKIGYLIDEKKKVDEKEEEPDGETSKDESSAAESSTAKEESSESDESEDEDKKIVYVEAYDSYFEFVLKGKIEKQYLQVYPLKEDAK